MVLIPRVMHCFLRASSSPDLKGIVPKFLETVLQQCGSPVVVLMKKKENEVTRTEGSNDFWPCVTRVNQTTVKKRDVWIKNLLGGALASLAETAYEVGCVSPGEYLLTLLDERPHSFPGIPWRE